MLIQFVNTALLESPLAVFFDGADGSHDMKMGILNAAVILVWEMNSEVHNHATAHKMLQ